MRAYYHLTLFFSFFVITLNSQAQCDTINLGNDTTLCEPVSLILDAGFGFDSYHWNNGSTGQYITVNAPGTYWCDVESLDSTNLVLNGDFSEGNIAFSTDYVWGVGGPYGILSEEGTYVIGTNASLTHVNFSPCLDHTTGTGFFMIINGDTVQGENVWCQTVNVEQNAHYYFSGWFTSVHPSNPALLSYFINSEVIETVNVSPVTCNWQNFVKEWYSGSNVTAQICIINQNTELGGNDFGIDDIHLLKYCPSSDTIVVDYQPPVEIDLGNDTTLCEGQELNLSAGGGYASYLWSNESSDSVLTVSLPGIYWVQVTSDGGCVGIDTIVVDFTAGIEIDLGSDTTLCNSGTLLLNAGEGFASYLWNDGTSLQTNLIIQSGTYWVTVDNGDGCIGTDTIQVEISPEVAVSLGGDTTLCSGANYTLTPGSNFSTYLWQNGSTTSSISINNPGVYWVIVTDANGCSGSDTITIGLSPSPNVNLGPDTIICTGSSFLLDPGSQFISYLWQDASDLPFYEVISSGNYSVTVTNQFNCSASDEVSVQVTSPSIDLGNDTLLCIGDTLFINPGQGYVSYLWQDNSSNPTYQVTTEGTYSVLVTDSHNCTSEEQVEITTIAKPEADLGGDQALCDGQVLVLETTQGPFTYTWNGEPGDYFLEIQNAGIYYVKVSNQCGSVNDQIKVTEYPTPYVYLGPDLVLQPGENIQLNAGEGFDEYIWMDGSGGQYYNVSSDQTNPGDSIYWVEVWNGPCKSSDTILIELYHVKIPNLITPNGDGQNDTFTPMIWSGVKNHHIEIFNRWGEKVWESENFESGWDGKYKGKYVAEGTYFWIIELFYGDDNVSQQLKGTVTVLKTGN